MKKLDSHALQKLRSQLEDLPPRQTLRPYDVIAQLAETITGVQARGYEIDDLVAVLNAAGITLARNTVRNYLSRALRERARNPVKTAVADVVRAPSGQDSGDGPAAPLPEHQGALARARERVQQRRNTNNAPDGAGRTAGSFAIVPDTEEL
jgi:hypothetical protein